MNSLLEPDSHRVLCGCLCCQRVNGSKQEVFPLSACGALNISAVNITVISGLMRLFTDIVFNNKLTKCVCGNNVFKIQSDPQTACLSNQLDHKHRLRTELQIKYGDNQKRGAVQTSAQLMGLEVCPVTTQQNLKT